MSEIKAWLFRCWQPGKSSSWATVDKDDNSWWGEGWRTVTRTPLVAMGDAQVIHGGEECNACHIGVPQ